MVPVLRSIARVDAVSMSRATGQFSVLSLKAIVLVLGTHGGQGRAQSISQVAVMAGNLAEGGPKAIASSADCAGAAAAKASTPPAVRSKIRDIILVRP